MNKLLLASFLAIGTCLTAKNFAEDAKPAETAPPPAEIATPPAAAPAPAAAPKSEAEEEAEQEPKNEVGRLIYLDGKMVYVDDKLNVVGQPDLSLPSDKKPGEDPKRKKREEAKARFEKATRIQAAIRRLGTSGYREAQDELVGYGKDAVPFLIEAMGNSETDGSVAPGSYQVGGHNKPNESHASNQRSRGEVCSELLTEIVSNHTDYKGELPTVSQDDWKAWWKANKKTVKFGS